ncbi:MAG: energy transducer TonB [Ekhidna sp.]
MRVFSSLILVLLSHFLFSQDSSYVEINGNEVLLYSHNAKFPGEEKAFYEYLKKEIRYPRKAWINNIEGKVITEFIVEIDGTLSSIRVLQGLGYGCDKEAIRLMKKSPEWTPSLMSRDKFDWIAIRQKMQIAIAFKK